MANKPPPPPRRIPRRPRGHTDPMYRPRHPRDDRPPDDTWIAVLAMILFLFGIAAVLF